jgi:hypothetical protein
MGWAVVCESNVEEQRRKQGEETGRHRLSTVRGNAAARNKKEIMRKQKKT